jgi:hypothetical protein
LSCGPGRAADAGCHGQVARALDPCLNELRREVALDQAHGNGRLIWWRVEEHELHSEIIIFNHLAPQRLD